MLVRCVEFQTLSDPTQEDAWESQCRFVLDDGIVQIVAPEDDATQAEVAELVNLIGLTSGRGINPNLGERYLVAAATYDDLNPFARVTPIFAMERAEALSPHGLIPVEAPLAGDVEEPELEVVGRVREEVGALVG